MNRSIYAGTMLGYLVRFNVRMGSVGKGNEALELRMTERKGICSMVHFDTEKTGLLKKVHGENLECVSIGFTSERNEVSIFNIKGAFDNPKGKSLPIFHFFSSFEGSPDPPIPTLDPFSNDFVPEPHHCLLPSAAFIQKMTSSRPVSSDLASVLSFCQSTQARLAGINSRLKGHYFPHSIKEFSEKIKGTTQGAIMKRIDSCFGSSQLFILGSDGLIRLISSKESSKGQFLQGRILMGSSQGDKSQEGAWQYEYSDRKGVSVVKELPRIHDGHPNSKGKNPVNSDPRERGSFQKGLWSHSEKITSFDGFSYGKENYIVSGGVEGEINLWI